MRTAIVVSVALAIVACSPAASSDHVGVTADDPVDCFEMHILSLPPTEIQDCLEEDKCYRVNPYVTPPFEVYDCPASAP